MKPILKILILFFGVGIWMSSPVLAQRSEEWVQENWQRVSGDFENFENQFPSQHQPQAHVAAAIPANDGFVRHADHQVASMNAQQPLAGNVPTSIDSSGAEPGGGSAAWTNDVKDQLQKINWPKVLGSLAIVVGGYLGFVWLMRKTNPKANAGLPSEVFELVGTTRLNTKQTLQLVRLGSKLLLLVHGDEGTHPIAEITDPEEVEYLTSVCNQGGSRRTAPRSTRPSRSSSRVSGFRSALTRANQEGDSTEAALDKVIRKLSELAGKASRTDFEA